MITPRKLSDMPPEEILRLPPCMDLDKFIMDKVLEGPVDLGEMGISLPMFSRNFGHSYPLMIMVAIEGEQLTLCCDDSLYESAQRAGQIVRKTEVKTWMISNGKYTGYGRTLPEAVCKLAICKRFGIRDIENEKHRNTGL